MKSGAGKNKDKKKGEVVGKINLTAINEDDDLYLSFLNKKMRYFTKKLKEISDLEKQEGELKAEQLQKLSKKDQFVQENAFYDETKFLYSSFLKETNCPGIKLGKEEKVSVTEEQKKANDLEKQNLQNQVQELKAKVEKLTSGMGEKEESIGQLKGMIIEQDEANKRMKVDIEEQTVKKIVELMFIEQYYNTTKLSPEKKIQSLVEPLKNCFIINEDQPLCNSLASSINNLQNYIRSQNHAVIENALYSTEVQNYLPKDEQEERAPLINNKQSNWNEVNDQEDSQGDDNEMDQKENEKEEEHGHQEEEEEDWGQEQPEEEQKAPQVQKKEPQGQKVEDEWHVVEKKPKGEFQRPKQNNRGFKKGPRQQRPYQKQEGEEQEDKPYEKKEYQPRGQRGGDYQPRGGRGDYQARGGRGGEYQPRGQRGGEYQPRGQRGGDYQPRGGRGDYQARGGRGGEYQPRGQRGGDYQPRGGRGDYQPRGQRGGYNQRNIARNDDGQEVYQEKFNE